VAVVIDTYADVRVIVWFDLSSTGGDFFTLDDETKGELDDTTYLLAGDLPVDVTDDVMEVSVERGKSSPLEDNIGAGTATITLDNSARQYDPTYASSPYLGNLKPGKRVRVLAGAEPLFDGLVDDWNYAYTPGTAATATMIATDALGTLALGRFLEWTTTAGQVAGQRITDVLNRTEVNFPANRSIVGGQSTLQADLVTWGSNVLNYLQLIARSDLGLFFAARDGVLTFRDRHAALNAEPVALFADDDAEQGFDEITVDYGSETLYNRVSVDRENGIAQTASDAESMTEFGRRGLAIGGLLLDSDAQSLAMAQYLLGLYKRPELRVDTVSVDMEVASMTQRATVAALDLGSVVQVRWTPSGIGDAIERNGVVVGIAHDVAPARHRVRLTLSDLDSRSFLTLNNSVLGALNANLLAF